MSVSGNGPQGGHRTPKKSTPIDIRRVPPVKSAFKPVTRENVPRFEEEEESGSRSMLYLACAAAFIAAILLVYSLSR